MATATPRDPAERLFGQLAAERERSDLSAFFVESVAFRRLRDGTKIIALGNRGAGKTAILSMIASGADPKREVIVELAPESFGYELLSESLRAEQAGSWSKQGAYAAAWKYLLYVLAMKAAVNASTGLKTGPAKRIWKYLRDNHANVDTNPWGALVSYLKRLEGVKVGKFEASKKARELHRLYRLEDVDNLLEDLNEMCATRRVVLLVDELDVGWDASEDAIAFVAGLFQACTSIDVRTPNVRVIMSLRRELYENIPTLFEDAQKVRDTVESVEWDSRSLLELMSRRIGYFLGDCEGLSAEQIWNRVMPDTVRGQPSFHYALGLTHFRPRELIQLCNQIQDVAYRRAAVLPFDETAVIRAEEVYARERYADLVAEYRFQYPELGSVLETFRRVNRTLTRDDLELHCLELAVGEIRVGPGATWVGGRDPDEIIAILWTVGFLLAEVGDESAADDGVAFAGAHQLYMVNLRNVQRFRIHDMFATYLACQ